MPCTTRTQTLNPAPAPAKRGPGRPQKRKASEDLSTTESPSVSGKSPKKNKTTNASLPPDPLPDPETTEHHLQPPSTASPSISLGSQLSLTAASVPSPAQPSAAPVVAPQTSLTSTSAPVLTAEPALDDPSRPNIPDASNMYVNHVPAFDPVTPGTVETSAPLVSESTINTRHQDQRAPTYNALQKENTELHEKVKQLTADLLTLKKFKVLWINEYAKKKDGSAAAGVAGAASLSLIARPPGEKGKNGLNLQEAMGLKDNDTLCSEILRTARHSISRSGLDWEATYSEQEPGRLAACFKELKKHHPYLERFQGDWPAKEMVISALQNRQKALQAKSKAKLATDAAIQNEMAQVNATLAAE
ncbi:hypothetical protein FRB90_008111 [Tulasnella sp. 427]|nr:hypothetical protein FRB90_008111 [Tulasnella sp. 427]